MEPSAEEEGTEITPAASEQQLVIAEGIETIAPAASELAAETQEEWKSSSDFPEMVSEPQVGSGPSRFWNRNNLLPATSDLGLPPQAAAVCGVSLLVGFDRPINKLLRWLTPQDETEKSLRVMALVGSVGMGKTALAMEIHNRLRCQTSRAHYHDFECVVMVRTSRRNDSNRLLLQNILSRISDPATPAASLDESQDSETEELLAHGVSERLQHKRYFICIDDMRGEASDWAKIRGAFPENNLGSRVLITTRMESVAQACCSGSDGLVRQMKPLNQADSERLLLKRAFGSLDPVLPKHVKLFVDEMLMRSEGVPLLVTGMADWLKERFESQQHYVQKEAEEQRQKTEIYDKQLELAFCYIYHGLTNDLKTLSFYVSMLPYCLKFEKYSLIKRWKNEGLSSHLSAQDNFLKLVDCNIITKGASRCKLCLHEAEACHWHVNHFFQQFLASKSAELGFAFTTATLKLAASPERRRCSQPTIPRRIFLHHPDPQLHLLLETMDLSETCSLSVSGAVIGIPLNKFLALVVLDLEGWENLTDEVLLQVCTSKMVLLRCLSIRNTRVSKLPHEIKELCNLAELDVSYTQIGKLPHEVFKLARLKELNLRSTGIRQLPKQIGGRILLYVLLIGGEVMTNSTAVATKLPNDIRNLSELRVLGTVDLREEPASFVTALGYLRFLEMLAITWSFHQCTDREYIDALISSIKKWESLKSLTIQCGFGCSMDFLRFVSDPPKKLEKFKVTLGRFANVPKWISKLDCLSFVQITVCKQDTKDLEILGGLPILQCLILGLDFIPTKAVAIESEGFPELERFSIDCPMPWLSFSTGAMPRLTYLQLKFCAIPARQPDVPSGIRKLRRLAEVDMCYNENYINSLSVRMTVDAVKKEVNKHPNPIDLFINGSEDYDIQAVVDVAENAVDTQRGTDAGTKDHVQAVYEKNALTQIQNVTEIEEIHSDAYFP